jgi:Predicted periplasmic protein (DUF2092)
VGSDTVQGAPCEHLAFRTHGVNWEIWIESSEREFSGPETAWEQLRSRDLFELLRLAIYLQCGLGSQQGGLAHKSLEDLPKLFDHPSTFSARLDAADRNAVAGKARN